MLALIPARYPGQDASGGGAGYRPRVLKRYYEPVINRKRDMVGPASESNTVKPPRPVPVRKPLMTPALRADWIELQLGKIDSSGLFYYVDRDRHRILAAPEGLSQT
jgi:hypothetical protein